MFLFSEQQKLKSYIKLARIDRPIGSWLLFFPCLWSILLASKDIFSSGHLIIIVLFGVGSIVMRGAGCTYNDIIDKDIDQKVLRTAKRPLASGEISLKNAVFFLILQLTMGLIILLQLNSLTIVIGLASTILILVYPYMKRITFWPQAWLALTFNWGALMGWSAVTGTIDWKAWTLYLAGFFWTMGYDTIYALQDKKYDSIIGVKSSAIALGNNTKLFLKLSYAIAIIFLSLSILSDNPSVLKILIISLGICHFTWQTLTLDMNNPEDCLNKFNSNRNFGFIIAIAIVI